MCGPPPDKIGPTYDQEVQADINNKMWDHYQKNYAPVRDKYIASRTDPKSTEAEKKQVAGRVNADVMKQVKPASATNAVVNARDMSGVADVKASAEQLGEAGVKAKQIGDEENIINMGKGQATKTMSGLDTLAGMSVASAIQDKQREQEVEAAKENAIGSAVGTVAAAGAYGARKMNKPGKTPADDPTFWETNDNELDNKWGR